MPKAVSIERIWASSAASSGACVTVTAVLCRDQVELEPLQSVRGDPAAHIGDWSRTRDNLQPLVAAGQKIRAPASAPGIRRTRSEHHERRQIPVLSPQTVADPGADARPGKGPRAGVNAECPLVVICVIRFHRANHANVIGDIAHMRKEIADLRAAFTAGAKGPLRRLEIAFEIAAFSLPIVDRNRFAMVGEEPGFRIERVDVRNAAGHVNEDDPLGPRAKCGSLGASGSAVIIALAALLACRSVRMPASAIEAKPPAAR